MRDDRPVESLLDRELACYCASPYDSPAARWLLGGELHPGGDVLTRRLAHLAGVRPGWRVLDVASGSGPTARLLASELGAEVTGVELSRESIATARREAEAAALGDRARFVEGDAQALPVASGAFDAVVCECALCLFSGKAQAVAEMRRALRPGGVVAIADVTAELEELPASLRGAVARVACVGGALPRDGYPEMLRDAGLELVASESHDGALAALAERVEARLQVARMLLSADGSADLIGEAIELVGEAQRAIIRGTLGYRLFVPESRSPRAGSTRFAGGRPLGAARAPAAAGADRAG